MVTFQQCLILADYDGIVDLSILGMHDKTGLPVDFLEAGIAALVKPRTVRNIKTPIPGRLVPLEGRDFGWRIVEYAKYSLDMFEQMAQRLWTQQQYQYQKNKKKPPSKTPARKRGRPPSVKAIMKAEGFIYAHPRCVPQNFAVTERVLAWAMKSKHRPDPKLYLESFKKHFKKKGARYADWELAFINWIRNHQPGGVLYTRGQRQPAKAVPADTLLSLQADLKHAEGMLVNRRNGKHKDHWLREVAKIKRQIEEVT